MLVPAVACGGPSLPEAPRGSHPAQGGATPIVVDSAPPPAVIERVTPAPDSECVWADGDWTFEDNEWSWDPGGWVRLVERCYYAPATLVWVPAVNQPGALFFTGGRWYRASDGMPCNPPPACASKSG